MLTRFLYRIKVDNYENHGSKPYKETACGVGVCIALGPQTFYAETLPVYIVESGGPLVKVNSRGAFLVRSDCQPLGEQISRIWHRRSSEQARPRRETYHGLVLHRKSHRSDT